MNLRLLTAWFVPIAIIGSLQTRAGAQPPLFLEAERDASIVQLNFEMLAEKERPIGTQYTLNLGDHGSAHAEITYFRSEVVEPKSEKDFETRYKTYIGNLDENECNFFALTTCESEGKKEAYLTVVHKDLGLFEGTPAGDSGEVDIEPADDDVFSYQCQSKVTRDPFGVEKVEKCDIPHNVSIATPQVVEVLVLYSRKVKKAFKDGGVECFVRQCIEQTNHVLSQSGVNAKIKLAHTRAQGCESKTLKGNINLMLNYMINGNAPFVNVHADRKQYDADLVVLLVEEADLASGEAMVLDSNYIRRIKDFKPFAYGVVRSKNAISTYTFAHEVFHMMGGGHDFQGAYCEDSRGYVSEDAGCRTVMAYPGKSSTHRSGYLSSPGSILQGTAMGVAGKHDNRRTILHTLPQVARFY